MKERERERKREKERERERERERKGEKGRERERKGEKGRERERKGEKGRERERNGEKGREKERKGEKGRERERKKRFNILISRKLPASIIRVLFDSYSRQQSRAKRNSCYTDYFYMSNGVKQGSVLSAILFTIYIDSLLILLKYSGVGCKINNCYTGAISYADDITLYCPSIRGLNRMLDICNKFTAEHYQKNFS